MNTLTNLDYRIREDLFFRNSGFPKEALVDAIKNKERSANLLLEHLEYAYANYEELSDDPDYYGVQHAIYLLAQFRETRAFPILLKLLLLPIKSLGAFYGDCIDNIKRLIGSLYNGDFEGLAMLIENPMTECSVRREALHSLVILALENILEGDFVINYLRKLDRSRIVYEDMFWRETLVYVGVLLHGAGLISSKDLCDFALQPDYFDQLFGYDEENTKNALKKYTIITDVVKELENWDCYRKEKLRK